MTLFDPPYSCTEEEFRQLLVAGQDDAATVAAARAREAAATGDRAWTAIYDLCRLRGDRLGADQALAQVGDRQWAAEMTYRDIVTADDA